MPIMAMAMTRMTTPHTVPNMTLSETPGRRQSLGVSLSVIMEEVRNCRIRDEDEMSLHHAGGDVLSAVVVDCCEDKRSESNELLDTSFCNMNLLATLA
jgi:hypothetical protein